MQGSETKPKKKLETTGIINSPEYKQAEFTGCGHGKYLHKNIAYNKWPIQYYTKRNNNKKPT